MAVILVAIVILLFLIFIIYNKTRKKFAICLMYHSIDDKPGKEGIFVDEFEEQMKLIKDKTSFKMEELKKINYKLPENSILVTFDDGYKNNYTLAYPILKKYNIKATIFLNTRYVGNNADYLSWENIKEMYESGLVDFQMHTHSHDLTIKRIKVVDFYEKDTSPYFKRESYNLFYEGKDGHFNVKNDSGKLDGLPVFKLISQVSVAGFRPKKNFVEKYRKIENSDGFRKKSRKEKIEFLNKLFVEKKDEFFYKIDENKFAEIVNFEILENKKIIEKNLHKTPFVLAYPWGHRYKGKREDLKKLGVEVFVTTRKGANSLNLKKDWIYRTSGDDFENLSEFKKEINNGETPLYKKIKKLFKF